jgi:NAD-dependent dihydropyrimidine dehydrogenase PreA subunit
VSFESQEKSLRELCESLLRDGKVKSVAGFGPQSPDTGLSPPLIAKTAGNAKRLSWNSRCVPSIARYLIGRDGPAAIAAKPCDARAVASLVTERQLERKDVFIIGMECAGMTDGSGAPLRACAECGTRRAPVCDAEITGAPETARGTRDAAEDFSPERFRREMDKCILCFSCRQACYGCYCETCFMDRGVPSWQSARPDVGAKMTYHLGRAMHLAGRCVECGACENVCASGVDARYLIRAATVFVEEEYGFRAGMDAQTPSALLTFKSDDPETGFWKDGKHD